MENTDFAYHQPIQTMYLSTIPNRKCKTSLNNDFKDIMKVDDIAGTRSKFIEKPIKPRQTYYNRNDDIDKSRSKILIPTQVYKQTTILSVDDIQGTRSKMNKFTTTRNTNPLAPVYQIPHVIYYPVEQPKFIRDNLITYDIEGTKTKQTFAMKIQKQGKVIDSKKIVQESVQIKKKNPLKYKQEGNNPLLDVSDINLKQKILESKRLTNPLDPIYNLPQKDHKGTYRYGDIQKNKPPKQKHKFNNPDFSLFTADITGARPKVNNFVIKEKQQIEGSKANTLLRGVSSKRDTNPLQPKYKYPGWSQFQKQSNINSFTQNTYKRPKTAVQRFDDFIK